jgi:L-ascorbate metabolism protein UlaG (beta-lactamase superfamily)
MRRLLLALTLTACRTSATAPSTPPPAAADPIALTWLGVAGWQLDAGPTTVLVDPYYTRPADLDAPVAPDPAAIAARAPARADLILVGHTHVDHALDAPAVALRTGAAIAGSDSTANLARASGVPGDRVLAFRARARIDRPGYTVDVIPSLHSKVGDEFLGGVLPPNPKLPLSKAMDYPEGGTFAYLVTISGQRIFFLGTANFIESNLTGLDPDVAVIATGLREKVEDYTCRLMRVLDRPPLVYANHFDDWTAAPVDAPVSDDLRAFIAEVERCSPATRVVIPQHFARMTLPEPITR